MKRRKFLASLGAIGLAFPFAKHISAQIPEKPTSKLVGMHPDMIIYDDIDEFECIHPVQLITKDGSVVFGEITRYEYIKEVMPSIYENKPETYNFEIRLLGNWNKLTDNFNNEETIEVKVIDNGDLIFKGEGITENIVFLDDTLAGFKAVCGIKVFKRYGIAESS